MGHAKRILWDIVSRCAAFSSFCIYLDIIYLIGTQLDAMIYVRSAEKLARLLLTGYASHK